MPENLKADDCYHGAGAVRAITVSVNFGDFLKETLPLAVPHFEKILVVTSYEDKETWRQVYEGGLFQRWPNVKAIPTNAFYRDGAYFNKGLALEEGFDELGRDGWICVFDADIVMPAAIDLSELSIGNLYSPRRRILRKVLDWPHYKDEATWDQLPLYGDWQHPGCFQVFHGSDPALTGRPWYGTRWRHAGGCDSDFQEKWPKGCRQWLPFEVLHLGEPMVNWCGRVGKRLDGTIPEGAEEHNMQLSHLVAQRQRWGYQKELLGFDEEKE